MPKSKSDPSGSGKTKSKGKGKAVAAVTKDDKQKSKSSSSSSSSSDKLKQPKLNFTKHDSSTKSTSSNNEKSKSKTATPPSSTGGRSLSSLGSMFALGSQSNPNQTFNTQSRSSNQSPSSSSSPSPATSRAIHPSQSLTSSQEMMPPPPIPISRKKPSVQPQPNASIDQQESSQIWSEKFTPSTRSDLAIHPRKITDVENWLKESLDGSLAIRKCRRLLVLTGPSGSGKTSVLNVLSSKEELDFELLEWNEEAMVGAGGKFKSSSNGNDALDDWKDPSSSSLGWTKEYGSTSVISKFDDFINSASRFSPLTLDSSSSSSFSTSNLNPRRVILLEDLPNLSHEKTYSNFQSILTNFLSTSNSIQNVNQLSPPIVIIISTSLPKFDDETWLTEGASGGGGNSDGNAASWKERKKSTRDLINVLDSNVRNHRGFAEISFNPIAERYLKKGLKRILELEFDGKGTSSKGKGKGKEKKVKPPLEIVEVLSKDSQGDIRNAINCLQFLSGMKLKDQVGGGGSISKDRKRSRNGEIIKKTSKGKGKSKGDADLKKQYSQLMSLISRRESSLALFHLIGKILYNKRFGDTGESSDEEDQDGLQSEEDSLSELSDEDDDDDTVTARNSKGKAKMKPQSKSGSSSKSKSKKKVVDSESSQTESEDEERMEIDSDKEDDFSWSDEEEEKDEKKSKSKKVKVNQREMVGKGASTSKSKSKWSSKLNPEEVERLKKRRERKEDKRDLKKWKELGLDGDAGGVLDFGSDGLPDHLKGFERRKSRVNVNVSLRVTQRF